MTPVSAAGVDIGDAQKIKGYYEIFEQFPVHYSLCRQEKTAPYPLCGTVSLRDSQDSVLHMKDSDGKEVPARLRITTKSTDPKEVKREIAEKAQILHTRFVGTGKAAGAYIPIEQLSFAEVINMYGAEYAQARSPHNDRRQKDRLDLLRHVAEGFAAIPCAKITQRQIGEFCEQLGETWYNKIREADFLMAYVAERRKYEQIANPFALYRESHAVLRNTQRLQKSAISTDVLSRDEVEQVVALVLEHLGDPDYVGIGLLLGTGLEAKQVAALKHGDIYEDPDNKGSLILDYHQPELSGSMHDFSFALSTLAARICCKRREMLEKGRPFSRGNRRSLHCNQQRRVVSREQAYCGESQFAAQLRRRICAAGRTDQQHGGRGRAAFAQHIRAAPGKRRRALRGPHTAPIHDAPAAGRHTRGVLSRLHGSICASLPGDRASAHPVEERKNDQ